MRVAVWSLPCSIMIPEQHMHAYPSLFDKVIEPVLFVFAGGSQNLEYKCKVHLYITIIFQEWKYFSIS